MDARTHALFGFSIQCRLKYCFFRKPNISDGLTFVFQALHLNAGAKGLVFLSWNICERKAKQRVSIYGATPRM